jgi:preprotein translocase subunit SecA
MGTLALFSPATLAAAVQPGAVWGPYPERRELPAPWHALVPPLQAATRAWQVRRSQAQFLAQLRQQLAAPPVLNTTSTSEAHLLAALGPLVQRHLGFTPHEVQYLAAWLLLQGNLVEMATGEGKTVATFLAAATAARQGTPVHVLTANDYLARRDAEALAPLYTELGLHVAWVQASSSEAERRAAYAAHVTYAPAREVAFDHLRDRLAFGRPTSSLHWAARGQDSTAEPRLRGLCLALIDEADAVLCDEARVPLIIAGPGRDAAAGALPVAQLLAILQAARTLSLPEHAVLAADGKTVRLTTAGRSARAVHSLHADARWREDWVQRALTALHTVQRERDYLVQSGKIVFIDPLTGRAAPERHWSRGVHQLLALKENLEPTPANDTLAQMTYRRLVARYHRVAGLSGTLANVRWEMVFAHGLPVQVLPRHQASQLKKAGSADFTLCADRQAWLDTVCSRVVAAHQRGQPVLVGTDSVADSEAVASALRALGQRAVVLNAAQNQLENEVIARAGHSGRITISTAMAGRGTDIRLCPASKAQGGLHVIACGMFHGRRQWRQLVGRAARQGDPGSAETILCIGRGVMSQHLSPAAQGLALKHPRVARALWRWAQTADEWAGAFERRRLAQQDRAWQRRLAYSGPQE